ncbi:hypothetical protein [Paraburkholderia sp. SIMBA_054]|uniref:hypothetical protein n=1 Tax=Paraburkholderia sp. SIMBA_054 TaxID=3085795 RepID=UPI00397D012C
MEMTEHAMLHPIFVAESYHIYVIANIARGKGFAPILLGLMFQLVTRSGKAASRAS